MTNGNEMTVGELREIIEDLDDEMEVRFMYQYNWPFECSISNSWMPIEERNHFRPKDYADQEEDKVLYLVEGTQIGYGTKDAWH